MCLGKEGGYFGVDENFGKDSGWIVVVCGRERKCLGRGVGVF